MNQPPFQSQEELKIFLSKSTPQQFQEALPHFSLSELASSLIFLQEELALERKSKLENLFQFIESPISLEILGKNLNATSFISFLEFLTQFHQYQQRLNFILVGLHPSVFSEALHQMQEHHLPILKQEGLLEPLQYQFTQFVHAGETLKHHIEKNIEQFEHELAFIDPNELTPDTLQVLFDQIDTFRKQLIDYLEGARTALAIIWYTNRIDLIEKLSVVNESIQYLLSHFVGHPASASLIATGIYAHLEQTFSKIFDASLQDEDAAIEGMTRLSVWHLKDYWELGLLPSISQVNQLELDPQKFNEEERWNHQQHLLTLVQQQLERLGIEKVKDLKKLHLFSKPLLKAYIEQYPLKESSSH
jgi:hypothetical protein